jgi:hypothetical protein
MFNWYEYYIDKGGNTQYYKCSKCGSFPAMALTFRDHNETGSFCQTCWYSQVADAFLALDKQLEDEDWGDSPDNRREVCHICGKYPLVTKRFVFLEKGMDVCGNCEPEFCHTNKMFELIRDHI